MAYLDYWSMLGYNNNAVMFMEAFGGSPNIILDDNPEYTLEEFKEIFPVFDIGTENEKSIPLPVFNMFVAMANGSIKEARYKGSWKYVFSLYIAHYLTLFLQTQAGVESSAAALQGAMPRGVQSSKSVDGLSVSYEFFDLASDMAGYGTYKLTAYGQQLVTMTKAYGAAGLWVNG